MRKARFPRGLTAWAAAAVAALALPAATFSASPRTPPQGASGQTEPIDDISGEYHFLSPADTLAILDEDGKLKGSIDVMQGDEESDVVFTYNITIGSREKAHVEFKTSKIHEKYYRFSGQALRGFGKNDTDSDYLRLVGELETITENAVTGQESVERQQVLLKSKSKEEQEQEGP